jgi:membrane-associated protease RseP (regulator of RpoE activity)
VIAYILGIVLFMVGVCLSISLHEAGHLLTARAFGMKVRRFFVGYGPTMFSFRRGGIEYGLKWIPLGGFCDIAGMTTLDKLSPDEVPRAMWRFTTWKRTVVMSAGAITHFVLGFIVLYLLAATMGLPNITGTPQVSEVATCVRDARTAEQVVDPDCLPGDVSPATAAGLRPGDEIVSVAGTSTPTYPEVTAAIRRASGPTAVQVERDGQTIPLTIDVPVVERPLARENAAPEIVRTGTIGVSFTKTFEYDALTAIGGAAVYAGDMVVQTAQRLIEFPERIPAVVSAIFGAERDPNTPVSVVGASRIGGEAVEQGLWPLFLLLLAGLNFFMGMSNLLPLLPMDGGHIAVYWYENLRDRVRRLRGKAAAGPVDYRRLASVTTVIVLLGGALVLLTVTADIVNPIRLS